MDIRSVTPAQGADTLVWLADAAEARSTSGLYWVTRREMTPSALARDDDQREQLWRSTMALAGLDADALIREALEPHVG
jgi:hypothetical protein